MQAQQMFYSRASVTTRCFACGSVEVIGWLVRQIAPQSLMPMAKLVSAS